MSSSDAVKPRVHLAPKAARSDGEDAYWLASQYGLTLDDWQNDILGSWLSWHRDGRWAAATCAVCVARQNGKNAIIEVRELFGMIELGEKFLHSAHEVKTSRKAFKRLKWFFGEKANDPNARFPELNALVEEVRNTNGQEAIVLLNGGSVEFVARTTGSGRGFTVDVLVLDECQALTDDELEAMLPAISAAPLGNPQVIFTGTPPNPEKNQTGEVIRRIRKEALQKTDKRLAWDDFGVPEGPCPNVNNRDLWFLHNPALGKRLNVAEVERERRLMSAEGFARERLCWWGEKVDDGADQLVPPARWAQLCDESARIGKVRAFALEVSMDRSSASLVAAGQANETQLAVEVLPWSRNLDMPKPVGLAWVKDRCVELNKSHGPAPFVIDAGGPAGSEIAELQQAGLQVVIGGLNEIKAATAAFVDAVRDGTIVHGPQDELDDAVKNAKKRPLGDGGYAISRKKSPVDVTPLIAVTLAHWAAQEHRPPEVYSIGEMVAQMRAEQQQQDQQMDMPSRPSQPATTRPDGSTFISY